MVCSGNIVAHLIVGGRPEPYLGAVLDVIDDVCDYAVIDDNSGLAGTINSTAIAQSRLARRGRLLLLHSSFTNFAAARNACIDATPPEFAGGWGLFVDADEVHGDELSAMAAFLPTLPDEIDAVDGYIRHFVGSFRWWHSVARRLCFFRLRPDRRWHGALHERLSPLTKRVALPVVWSHYGHVIPPQREVERGRLYRSLGQNGRVADLSRQCDNAVAKVWGNLLRRAILYRGAHTKSVANTVAELSLAWATTFEQVDDVVSQQTTADRIHNAIRSANYSRLIAWRSAEASLRWHWRDGYPLVKAIS